MFVAVIKYIFIVQGSTYAQTGCVIMEILYLIPGAGMPKEEIARRTDVSNSIASTDTSVTVLEVGIGPLSIESSIEEHMAIGPMLRYLNDIHRKNQYDAIIIGCAGDPGLRPARELLDIPVIGPAESSYHLACMVSDRFSVLSTLQAGVESDHELRSRLRASGLESYLVSVEFIKLSVTDLWKDNRDVFIDQLSESVLLAKEKGAGSVVLGCMSMAFLMVDELVSDRVLPIINPLKVAIKTAEMFVDLKLTQSKITYPAADIAKLRESVFPDK